MLDPIRHNKQAIQNSKLCGCCYCLSIMPAIDVTEFVDRTGDTGLCPLCSVDAIVPDAIATVTIEVLHNMYKQKFSEETGISATELRRRLTRSAEAVTNRNGRGLIANPRIHGRRLVQLF
jgi:hypothetical protein